MAQGNTQTQTLLANATSQMIFPVLSRPQYLYSVNTICNVPPGFKLGLLVGTTTIRRADPVGSRKQQD